MYDKIHYKKKKKKKKSNNLYTDTGDFILFHFIFKGKIKKMYELETMSAGQ